MQLNTQHRAKHKCVYHASGYNTNVYIYWCIHVCVCVCVCMTMYYDHTSSLLTSLTSWCLVTFRAKHVEVRAANASSACTVILLN